jgi:shikimate kinase
MGRSGEIRLIGPGGAGKSTIGALVAERLGLAFFDLDRYFAGRVGDISGYINRNGYDAYARANVAAYWSLCVENHGGGVHALSSGFMTYASDIHPDYPGIRQEIVVNPRTFVLLPSLDRDVCVAETVRRQTARAFGRTPAQEERVIRSRFEIYMAVPARRIETMRPLKTVVDEITSALSPHHGLPGERLYQRSS